MQKIKSVLSHGSRKSVDASEGSQSSPVDESRPGQAGLQGEGSHLAGAKESGDGAEGVHPIYDEFTGKGAAGEPTNTTEQTSGAPAESSRSAEQPAPAVSSNLRPDAAHRATGDTTGAISTASIKSGVLGFPQGGEKHAALGKDSSAIPTDASQTENSSSSNPTEHGQFDNATRDAAVGAGAAGAGGLAARELADRRKEDAPKQQVHTLADERTSDLQSQPSSKPVAEKPTERPLERSAQEPSVVTDTDRSFPLAGGVTHRAPVEKETAPRETPTTVTDREPGTKDREVEKNHGDGREALAGAAAAGAAATAAYGLHDKHERSATSDAPSGLKTEGDLGGPATSDSKTDRDLGVNKGAAVAAATTAYGLHDKHERDAPQGLKTEGDLGGPATSGTKTEGDLGRNTDASTPVFGDLHEHSGQGHSYDGPRLVDEQKNTQTGPMFTEGPHVTDAANRYDPHLHIPGEFPGPTPVEEPAQPSFTGKTEGPVTVPSGSRSTGTTSNLPSEKPAEEHHYGRDAAVAGGVGAAGLGAYEAGKHHQRETAEAGNAPTSDYASPYSSHKIDPRVNPSARGVGGLDEQRFDPTAKSEASPHDTTEQHHGRDAALVGGTAAGAGGLAGYEASKHRAEPEANQSPAAQQQAPVSQEPTSQGYSETQKEPKEKDHHYGRDAALAGAGATGLAGYEASKHRSEPESTQPSAAQQPAPTSQEPTSQTYSQTQGEPKAKEVEPKEKDHHYGRDAAVAGAGAAAAGGLYENEKQDSGPASKTIGPHKSNILNVLDPRVQPDPALQKHNQTATSPQQSDTQTQDQHHYGRDAALAGGAGAASVGAYEAAEKYDQHRSTQPSASMDDQRYDPTAQGAHDPTKPSQHHYGRDAAVAGGVGAAGVGAHEYAKHEEKEKAGPGATGGAQSAFAQQLIASEKSATQEPQSQHHYGRDAALAGGAGAAGVGAYEYAQHDGKTAPGPTAGAQPTSAQQPPVQETQPQHHYGRDAALAGGAGAAGVGAYEYAQHHDKATPAAAGQPSPSTQQPYSQNAPVQQSQDPTKTSQHHYGRDAAVAGGVGAAGVGAYEYAQHRDQPVPGANTGAQDQAGAHQRYDSVQDPNNQQHQKRDAAVAAGATGAAGAGVGTEFSKHEAEKHQKEQEKAFQKQQKEIEKQQAKEQKEHSKLVAAENKKHEKEIEKEHQKQVKEAEKEEEKPKEKKHHLFGFLHRDKKDKDRDEAAESEPRTSKESPRHSKEYAAAGAGAAGAAGAGAAAYASGHDSDGSPSGKHRNKLHKDPPPGHPAREAMEHQQELEQQQHMGVDGPIGRSGEISGDRETEGGVYGAHPAGDNNTEDRHVIEPHTGLPMNVGKYGDGAGGTDGSETVSGYHEPQGQGQTQGLGAQQQQGATDWEGIKKANTPY